MFKEFAKVLPSRINRYLGPLYWKLSRIVGKNTLSYDVEGIRKITFQYDTYVQFNMFYDIFDGNKITHEDIPIEYFILDDYGTFIDIGSYHGLYSTIVGKLNPEVDIYCFEPSDYNRQILQNTLSVNEIEAKIRGEVVSGTSGEIMFYERDQPDSQGHSISAAIDSIEITKNSIRISDFILEGGFDNVFLKIDAEGAETEIIHDIEKKLSNCRISGVVEFHPDKMDQDINKIINTDLQFISIADGKANSENRPIYYFNN